MGVECYAQIPHNLSGGYHRVVQGDCEVLGGRALLWEEEQLSLGLESKSNPETKDKLSDQVPEKSVLGNKKLPPNHLTMHFLQKHLLLRIVQESFTLWENI